jgi:Toprim domain-containing protein
MRRLSLSPRTIARALGGEVSGGQVLFPGPGHSPQDRSACLRLDPGAPGGFVVHSFAGDDPLLIRDHVRERLGLPSPASGSSRRRHDHEVEGDLRAGALDDAERTRRAPALWSEAHDPRETLAASYLRRRGVELPDEAAGEALRFHPACPFAGQRTPALVALVRDVVTNEPRAIHRTALDLRGHKIKVGGKDRLAFGPVTGAAVKITPDEDVTLALGIGEGVETTLSLRELPEFAGSPVWALLSSGGLAAFPVLAGIECLWIAVGHDPAGERAAHTCADHWRVAGREVFLVRPRAERADLNDTVKRRKRHAAR